MFTNAAPTNISSSNAYFLSVNNAILWDSPIQNDYNVKNLTYTSVTKGYSIYTD